MFKEYYLPITAVKITRENFHELTLLDDADGVLECGLEECLGDWFFDGTNGYELMAGNVNLIPRE